MIFQMHDRFCAEPYFHEAQIWASLHYVHVSCLTDIHTPNPTFPTMQGQTLSSEAHWDTFQNSSSTGCRPPAHTHAHTWLAATDMVSVPRCRQRPQPALALCATCGLERQGGLRSITQSEGQTWCEMTLLVWTMACNEEKHQERRADTHTLILMVTSGQ